MLPVVVPFVAEGSTAAEFRAWLEGVASVRPTKGHVDRIWQTARAVWVHGLSEAQAVAEVAEKRAANREKQAERDAKRKAKRAGSKSSPVSRVSMKDVFETLESVESALNERAEAGVSKVERDRLVTFMQRLSRTAQRLTVAD